MIINSPTAVAISTASTHVALTTARTTGIKSNLQVVAESQNIFLHNWGKTFSLVCVCVYVYVCVDIGAASVYSVKFVLIKFV